MLQQVLQEIEAAGGTVNLNDLAHKLDLDRGVLAGMIEFWIRKGRIKTNLWELDAVCAQCSGAACGQTAQSPDGCPFVIKMPRTFSLVNSNDD